jgi:predicted 3-demethylubiquinone-9 3-methyltransferase (glyoxalase superfamily)
VAGRAQEAIDLYCGVFQGSRRGQTARYPAGSAPDKPGTLMFGDFQVLNTWLAAMDSAHPHGFAFNEAVSLLIPCDTQREIDYYWERLAVDPDAGQCGWIKDRFGVSWQVHPTPLSRMLAQGTPEQVARVTQAFLAMKKFDIAALEREFAGEDCGDRASM